MEKETVVIVGYGWVGQANAIALRVMGYPVYCYDVGQPTLHYERQYAKECSEIQSLSHAREHDGKNTVYLVCVGDRVSQDGVQDISSIKTALESLKGVVGTVVLRSTVLPESLKELSFDFYVPEFLHEKKAVEECLNPYYFVVGKREKSTTKPSFFVEWRKRAHRVFEGTSEEASYVKYLSNIWNALRIAFSNEFGDAIAQPTDKESLSRIEKVINFVFEQKPYMRYGKAFTGHCLPKDSRAFLRSHKGAGKNMQLIEGMIRSNEQHEAVQESYPILPEWYSGWPKPLISGREALKALRIAIRRRITRPFSIGKTLKK